jgi:hypothetical protein
LKIIKDQEVLITEIIIMNPSKGLEVRILIPIKKENFKDQEALILLVIILKTNSKEQKVLKILIIVKIDVLRTYGS